MTTGALRHQVFETKLRLVRPAELAELRALAQSERLDAEKLRSLQQARAAEIVRFAMAHTDYYRERYARAGIGPRDLADPQAFESLPVLERADLRENRERIRSSEATPANVQRAVTGGTTGEPLRVLRDNRVDHRTLGWRLHRWWGVGPSENKARDLAGRHHRLLEDAAARGALVADPQRVDGRQPHRRAHHREVPRRLGARSPGAAHRLRRRGDRAGAVREAERPRDPAAEGGGDDVGADHAGAEAVPHRGLRGAGLRPLPMRRESDARRRVRPLRTGCTSSPTPG